MTSLRQTALVWITALLMAVGSLAFFVSYELARREAADFLGGQLRQIALNAGTGLVDAEAPVARHDPEDGFVIGICNPAGEAMRNLPNRIVLPRYPAMRRSTQAARTGVSTWLATPAVRFRWRNA